MRACLAAIVVVSALVPEIAHAQSCTFTNPIRNGSPRANDPGAGGYVSAMLPIGLRDCPSETWTFTVNYTAPGPLTSMSYWIGVDTMVCGSSIQRYPVATGNAQCWHINYMGLDRVSPPSTGTYMITIPSRYIVDPLNGDCANPSTTQGTLATNNITLLGFPPTDSNIIGTPLGIPYNVSPPVGPSGVTAAPGESSAEISWSYAGNPLASGSDGGVAAPSNLLGFWLLCDHDPIPVGDGGITGMDAGTDAGTDIGTDVGTATDGSTLDATPLTGPACGTPGFLAIDPNNDAQFNQYLCPNQMTLIGSSSTNATAVGLTNFVAYRFAVVAQDTAGNRSMMAVSANCVTPVPVTSFWDHYRAEGGQALPGYCSARPWNRGGTSPVPWGGLGLLGGLVSLRRAGRRKSRHES